MLFWKQRQNCRQTSALRAGGRRFRRALPLPPFRCGRSGGGWKGRRTEGSMSVEASLALPLFLFFLVNILFILEMVRLQSGMLAALHETGTQIAEYCYYYRYGLGDILDAEAGDATYEGETGAEAGWAELVGSAALSQTFVRSRVEELLGREYLEHSPLSGGPGCISYLQSKILCGGDTVDLVADYPVRPLISLFGIPNLALQSRFYAHAWVGYDLQAALPEHDKKPSETMAYITDTGTVYHRSRGCSYLNPSVRTVSMGEMAALRNSGGGKYYPCEICSSHLAGTVLITRDGNRYHSSAACSGLKRTVREVPLESVEGRMPPCSRCGAP